MTAQCARYDDAYISSRGFTTVHRDVCTYICLNNLIRVSQCIWNLCLSIIIIIILLSYIIAENRVLTFYHAATIQFRQ